MDKKLFEAICTTNKIKEGNGDYEAFNKMISGVNDLYERNVRMGADDDSLIQLMVDVFDNSDVPSDIVRKLAHKLIEVFE
jgi:hypothetical protein